MLYLFTRVAVICGLLLTSRGMAQAPPPDPFDEHATRMHVSPTAGHLSRPQTGVFEQLNHAGYAVPRIVLGGSFAIDHQVTSWLRVGMSASYMTTGATTTGRVHARQRIHAGIIDLGVTPFFKPARRWELGLHLAAGVGRVRWVAGDSGTSEFAPRLSAAADVYFAITPRDGLGVRLGYRYLRAGGYGPLDLPLDVSHGFFEFRYARRIGR